MSATTGAAWTVKRAGPDDATALALVGAATFLETYALIIEGADILAQCAMQHQAAVYAGWLAQPRTALFLGLSDTGAPVGYAVTTPPSLEIVFPGLRDDDMELRRIYALTGWHGGGLGPALMAGSVEAASSLGARRLLVGVNRRNARALSFYARLGFSEVATRRFEVGGSEYDDLVLGLSF